MKKISPIDWLYGIIFGMLIAMLIIVMMAKDAKAVEVDMSIIGVLESCGKSDSDSYRGGEYGRGKYGVSDICLQDYNDNHMYDYTPQDMYDEDKCFIVGNWYANEKLPQYYEKWGINDNIPHRLIGYNYGPGNLRDKKDIPLETRNYIIMYYEYKRKDS